MFYTWHFGLCLTNHFTVFKRSVQRGVYLPQASKSLLKTVPAARFPTADLLKSHWLKIAIRIHGPTAHQGYRISHCGQTDINA